MAVRGVSLVDLIGLPPGSTTLLPSDMRAELAKLAVVDLSVITSADAFIYTGTIRSLGEALFSSSLNWPIELPLLNVGVPFQLVRRRVPVAPGADMEPAPDGFQLDLLLERVAIVVPGLQPAMLVPGAGVTAAHLVRPVPGQALHGKPVKIVGSGTLRLVTAPGGGAPLIRFVASPDPLDPDAPTGALVSLAFQPASFFFGSSDYGMTVDTLLYDDSESFTPAEIEARNQGPEWRGISIKEATLFFPRNAPAVGDVSVGVRDVLLGSPLGLQGEVRIELGTTPVDPATLAFVQHQVPPAGADQNLGAPATIDPRTSRVNLQTGEHENALVSGSGAAGSNFRFRLPDGRTAEGRETGRFAVAHGEWMTIIGLEGSGADQAESPAVNVQFVGAPPAAARPVIEVTLGGTTRSRVLSVSGSRAALAGLTFALNPATDPAHDWELGTGVGAATGRGATFTPDFPATPGRYQLIVGKPGAPPQRVEVEVLPEGELILGCGAGVFDAAGPVLVRSVEGSFSLPAFNQRGEFQPAPAEATVAGGAVSVPAEVLAAVTIERGSGDTPAPPETQTPHPRHVQILMSYDDVLPERYIADGDAQTALPAAWRPDLLHGWRDRFSGAEFIIVGRTCDIGSANHNEDLSARRAEAGKALLAAPAGTAFRRGERLRWNEVPPQGGAADTGGATVESGSGIPANMTESAVAPATFDGWLFKILNGDQLSTSDSEAHDRPRFRRVDIHAVGGTIIPAASDPPSASSQAATVLRRALVPGILPPALNPRPPLGVARPYRVRLVIRWDSPTVTQLSDAIPTMAEVTVAWQSRALPVPGGSGNVTPTATQPSGGTGPEIFTFVGGWTYDPRTTATQFSLALNSTGDPDGLATLSGDSTALNAVATALALGPALLAGIQSGDVASGAARVAALVGAIGFAAAFGRDGKVILHGVKVEWRQRAIDTVAGARFRLLCDYTAAIGFEFNQFGIHITADKPIKVRYRDVGIEIDSSQSGFDAFGVVYENASFDIADPGQWTIAGPLGDLVRVAATRAGSGSTWVELDLRFALDLGVVKITGCTLRASFSSGGLGIEFRGFSASIDLPGVVRGSGAVSIGDQGMIRAGLAAEIIPINVSATASLALLHDFVALEVGVLLPVGIPLAQSGLAIYGFVGRVVSNGRRNLANLSPDPVQRELDWYRLPGQNKYVPAPGQWAMGLGISVGTMPDTGFTFNALGMLSVGFPDPDVVISIDASLFKRPQLPAADNSSPQAGLTILGVIAISPDAVVVGVRGRYEIPHVLRLELPFGAYFPLPGNPDPAFVRIGADGVNGRTGDPVSLTLLPDTLDIGVWAYTMVEERNLLDLGGVQDFDLNGFSIGFGAGWAMQWGGGPIYLRASAKILAGMGTKPLTIVAGLFVEGALRLIVVTLSVRGNVKALITENNQSFSGEFCGKVDFFFFSVEGCVDVSFGNGSDPGIPLPDHPLTRVDLTSRVGAIVGRAYRSSDAQDPDLPPLAWPDTVPLLNLSAYVQNRLAGSAFAPNPAELPGEPWSGSTELKYAYRLKTLAIRKQGQAAMPGPLESVWWWPTHRGGVLDPSGPPPSEQEGRQLALLSWHPAPWARNLIDGGAGSPADPGNTVGQLCVPVTESFRGCVRGDRLVRQDFATMRLSGLPGTRFHAAVAEFLPGSASLADAAAAVALAGWQLIPGGASPLSPPVDVPAGPQDVVSGYRLAGLAHGPQFVASLGARVVPTLALDAPVLTLELCAERSAGGSGGRCDDFADLRIGTPVGEAGLTRHGVTYRWQSKEALQASPVVDHFAPERDGKAELWVGSKGLLATFDAPTDRVELTVAYAEGEPIVVEAFEVTGLIVGRAVAGPGTGQAEVLVIEAPRISAVSIRGGTFGAETGISRKSGGSLLKLCRGRGGDDSVGALLWRLVEGGEAGRPPLVEAHFADGSTSQVEGSVVGETGGEPITIHVPSRRQCVLVQYAVPPGRILSELRIQPWTGGRVAVVSLCGTDWVTSYIQDINADVQSGTADTFGSQADPATSSERPNLLDADTAYEIVIGMQWVGWRRNRDDPATAQPPPLTDALGWTDFPDQVFSFRTAPEAILPDNPAPADFRDEREFDPRGLVRYLLGFEPDGTGAPHFLDDPIKVHFRVDHIAPMLAKYGRGLRLKLRRTDPPPSSLATSAGLGGSLVPPDIATVATVGLLSQALLEASDALLVEAAVLAPCTEPPAVGGRTIDIEAPLEPDADYDLLLVAPPTATPDADTVLVARSHFHTSRYANPAAMLEAMALATSGSPDPRLPFDALVDPAVPAAAPVPNDAAFEAALAMLGMDPWPLPVAPRVVALWSRTAPFRLRGVMIETDEPMQRGARMTVTGISAGGVALQQVAFNTATTRGIWMAASPIALGGETVIDVAVSANGAVLHGRRTLLQVPRLALLEGVA